MWQRFTRNARVAVLYAQEEAVAQQSEFVGTEHILLGLLRDESCSAVQFLITLGQDPQAIRGALLAEIAPGTAGDGAEPKLTVEAKWVLEFAADEAFRARQNEVHSGHLLSGLMRLGEEGESWSRRAPAVSDPAVTVLSGFGITLAALRELAGQFPTSATAGDDRQEASMAKQSETAQRKGFQPRFTERTRRAILCAQEEAEKAGSLMTPEYLLLGVLRERKSIGAIMLVQMGAELEQVRKRMPAVHHPGAEPKLTPECARILEIAADEAAQVDHKYIGTEHLVLALRHDETVAGIFESLGLNGDELARRVRDLIAPEWGT